MLRKCKVSITIDNKVVDISESAEVNHPGGLAKLVTQLVYRSMLACGFTATVVGDEMGNIARSIGCSPEYEDCKTLFDMEQ